MKTIINWRVFFILWIAAILASIAVLPYALELQGSTLESLDLPIPLPAVIALQIVQSAILLAIIIFAGMFFANRVGLRTPILDSITRGEPISNEVRAILPISIGLGIIASLLIIGLEVLIFQPALLKELGDSANTLSLQNAQPAAWKGFLASFYGGIAEEILLRLFVMSFLAWLGRFVSKTQEGKPTSAVFWIANILAAVLFGLGHLPATAMLIPLTPLVITPSILLNGIGGVIFGWLYWKRGLEAAMFLTSQPILFYMYYSRYRRFKWQMKLNNGNIVFKQLEACLEPKMNILKQPSMPGVKKAGKLSMFIRLMAAAK